MTVHKKRNRTCLEPSAKDFHYNQAGHSVNNASHNGTGTLALVLILGFKITCWNDSGSNYREAYPRES